MQAGDRREYGPLADDRPYRGAAQETLHASCVGMGPRALLLAGASGAGKSGLALQLMACGASLIADDRTLIARTSTGIWASCPPAIAGLIEARGIGVLGATPLAGGHVVALVDLDREETDRLPAPRTTRLLDCDVPLILRGRGLSFAAALIQYLKSGRCM